MSPSRKTVQSECSIDVDEVDDDLLNERCCFGQINLFTAFTMLAVLNIAIDMAGGVLAKDSELVFFFGIVGVGSLLCLAAIVTSVCEEKNRMVYMTQVWVVFKVIIMVLSVIIIVVENMSELQLTGISMSPLNEVWPLIMLMPFLVVFLGAQFFIGCRVMKLIRIRDEVYVIPSPMGSVRLRKSLREEFERRKSMAQTETGLAKY